MPVVKNLMIRAGADFSAVTKQSQKVVQSVRGMQSAFERASAGIKQAFGALAAVVSVTAIVNFARDAREAYEEAAEAEAKLTAVMRNTMSASTAEIRSIKELCEAQQELGVVETAVQVAGAQELATYLSQTNSLKKLIPVMNDMVAQQHGYHASAENAVNIATMLGKVMEGQVSALSRYGYYFTAAQQAVLKYGDEAQRAALLTEIIERQIGGMNEALAATRTGRLVQLNNTLGDIKENFGQAVTMLEVSFLPALQRVASWLAKIADFANRVSQSFANVFGTAAPSAVETGGTQALASGFTEVTEEAEEAGKEVKKTLGLLSIDEMNILRSTKSETPDTKAAEDAAESVSAGFAAGAEDTTESFGWLEKALRRVKEWADKLNLEPLQNSFARLREAGARLRTALSGLLSPLGDLSETFGTWLVETAAPAVLNGIADACDWLAQKISDLSALLKGDMSFGQWLNTLSPIELGLLGIVTAIGAVNAAMGVTQGIAKAGVFLKGVKELGAGIVGFVKTPLGGISMVLGGLTSAVTGFVSMWNDGFSIAKAAVTALGIALTAVGAVILGAPAAVAAIVAAIVAAVAGLALLVKEHWQEISDWLLQRWEKLKNGVINIGTSIKNFFVGIFDGLVGKIKFIKTIIITVLTGINNFTGGFINKCISAVETFINGFIDGINKVKAAINSMQFKIPDWVPEYGGKSIGPNLQMTPKVQLPRLASGAVIPPGQEFAAILGDQMSGRNLEAPEALLRQIYQEENGSSEIIAAIFRAVEMLIRVLRDRDGDFDIGRLSRMLSAYQRRQARAADV